MNFVFYFARFIDYIWKPFQIKGIELLPQTLVFSLSLLKVVNFLYLIYLHHPPPPRERWERGAPLPPQKVYPSQISMLNEWSLSNDCWIRSHRNADKIQLNKFVNFKQEEKRKMEAF